MKLKKSIRKKKLHAVLLMLIMIVSPFTILAATVRLTGPSSATTNSSITLGVSISGYFFADAPGRVYRGGVLVKSFMADSGSLSITGVPTGPSAGNIVFSVSIIGVGSSSKTISISSPAPATYDITSFSMPSEAEAGTSVTATVVISQVSSGSGVSLQNGKIWKSIDNGMSWSIATTFVPSQTVANNYVSVPVGNDGGNNKFKVSAEIPGYEEFATFLDVLVIAPISFSFYEMQTLSYENNAISKQYVDYRDVVSFNKYAQYYSQVMRDYPEFADIALEVSISFMYQAVASTYWSPTLRIQYDSGLSIRMSSEPPRLAWDVYGAATGGGYGNSLSNPHPMIVGNWYDWKLSIAHANPLNPQDWRIDFKYKESSSIDWILLDSQYISSTLGTPSVIIGTNVDYNNQYEGPIDEYYFANFGISNFEDQDGDGLTDLEEFAFVASGINIDYLNPDTDDDGLSDSVELNTDASSYTFTILRIDTGEPLGFLPTEAIGGNNYTRLLPFDPSLQTQVYYMSNPTAFDTDGDGLSDGQEIEKGTSPNSADTDEDGVNDASDNEPTVKDNFAPNFLDIQNEEFDYNGNLFTVPTESNPGDGVYFYMVKQGSAYYIMMKVYDDSGIDFIKVTADPYIGSLQTIEEDGGGNQYFKLIVKIDEPWQNWDIYVTAFDVDGHISQVISFEITGSFIELIKPITDFVQVGVSWISDRVEAFMDWAGGIAQSIVDAATEWLREAARKFIKFVEDQINQLVKPFAESMITWIERILISINNYESGQMIDIINLLVGGLLEPLTPIIQFLDKYESEIEYAKTALDVVLSLSSPIKIASLTLPILGSTMGADGFGDLDFDNPEIETVTGVLADIFLQAIGLYNLDFNSLDITSFDLRMDKVDLFKTELRAADAYNNPMISVMDILTSNLENLGSGSPALTLNSITPDLTPTRADSIGDLMAIVSVFLGFIAVGFDYLFNGFNLDATVSTIFGMVAIGIEYYITNFIYPPGSGDSVTTFIGLFIGLTFIMMSFYFDLMALLAFTPIDTAAKIVLFIGIIMTEWEFVFLLVAYLG